MSHLNTYKQGLKSGQLIQVESKIKDNEWELNCLTKEKNRLEKELRALQKEEQDEVCVDFEKKEIDKNVGKLKTEEQNAK